MPEAITRICDWIQHIAVYARAPQKYHYTVSRAWVEIVAHHVEADPDCADFGTFAARHPALLDKRLLSRHYRSSTLAAPRRPARLGRAGPPAVPLVARSGQQGGLINHPPPGSVRLAPGYLDRGAASGSRVEVSARSPYLMTDCWTRLARGGGEHLRHRVRLFRQRAPGLRPGGWCPVMSPDAVLAPGGQASLDHDDGASCVALNTPCSRPNGRGRHFVVSGMMAGVSVVMEGGAGH